MVMSSRISVPASVQLGQTVTASISVICWGPKDRPTNLLYGIGYAAPSGNAGWLGWKNYSKSVPCDQPFEFTFEVTQDMWDKQKAGYSLFAYSNDDTTGRFIGGVGKCKYSYFSVTKPGVTPIGGRVWVAMRIGKRRVDKDNIISTLYADQYKNGTIYKKGDRFGDSYTNPDGKIFRGGFSSFWGTSVWYGRTITAVRFMKKSLYDTLAADEQEWLGTVKNFWVVPDTWMPSDGAPRPTCTLAGSFTELPKNIPITAIPNWGPRVDATNLPVTLDLSIGSCKDVFGSSIAVPNTPTTIPVTFSVNNINIATLFPSSPISLDLIGSVSLWTTAIPTGTHSITLRARTPATVVGEHLIEPLLAEAEIPLNMLVPPEPEPECTENTTKTCEDGSVITTYLCIGGKLYPTGRVCPKTPEPECTENTTKTCEDGSVITTYLCIGGKLYPTGRVCPPTPIGCTEGAFKDTFVCPDGSSIYLKKCVDGVWVDSGQTCPVAPTPTPPPTPTPGPTDKRLPVTCRDGSTIYQEAFVDGAWIPSGEKCPEDIAKRTLIAAVPKIMYAGQTIDIVTGVYIGAAASTNETAILTIDGVEVDRMNTQAGEAKFRWTAEGVGMHNLCITVPPNVNSPTPGSVCKTIMVSADIGSVKEQVKSEMDAYTESLARLRDLKKLNRDKLKRHVQPGWLTIPATLAGSIIEIGGVIRTVPEGGLNIPIESGDYAVGVIKDGIKEIIDIIVLPGEVVTLP